jgi:hypothetical protein
VEHLEKEKMRTFVEVIVALLAAQPQLVAAIGGYIKYEGPVEHVVTSPLPHEYLSESDLPEAWDWRNVNGTNYAGRVLNQKNPHVCGSCWAQAATGAVTDRFIIATQGKFQSTLAPQNLLNFRHFTGGSCDGILINIFSRAQYLKYSRYIYYFS